MIIKYIKESDRLIKWKTNSSSLAAQVSETLIIISNNHKMEEQVGISVMEPEATRNLVRMANPRSQYANFLRALKAARRDNNAISIIQRTFKNISSSQEVVKTVACKIMEINGLEEQLFLPKEDLEEEEEVVLKCHTLPISQAPVEAENHICQAAVEEESLVGLEPNAKKETLALSRILTEWKKKLRSMQQGQILE